MNSFGGTKFIFDSCFSCFFNDFSQLSYYFRVSFIFVKEENIFEDLLFSVNLNLGSDYNATFIIFWHSKLRFHDFKHVFGDFFLLWSIFIMFWTGSIRIRCFSFVFVFLRKYFNLLFSVLLDFKWFSSHFEQSFISMIQINVCSSFLMLYHDPFNFLTKLMIVLMAFMTFWQFSWPFYNFIILSTIST